MILMAAGFLTGCMETSEDDCIVKEKETETGDSIRSYSSGTEAVENVSVAEQVQAASPCMLSVEEGKIHVDLQASVYLPQGNSMKIYKAKTRYFTQEDMNGWIHILTQGQPLKNDKGDTISWRAQQELTGTVKMTDPYASWAAAGKKVYSLKCRICWKMATKNPVFHSEGKNVNMYRGAGMTAGKFCIQRLEENG